MSGYPFDFFLSYRRSSRADAREGIEAPRDPGAGPGGLDRAGQRCGCLRDAAPELVERPDDVATELERDGDQATADTIDRRMSLAHEWDSLVQRVRKVLGADSVDCTHVYLHEDSDNVIMTIERSRVRSANSEPNVPELVSGS